MQASRLVLFIFTTVCKTAVGKAEGLGCQDNLIPTSQTVMVSCPFIIV